MDKETTFSYVGWTAAVIVLGLFLGASFLRGVSFTTTAASAFFGIGDASYEFKLPSTSREGHYSYHRRSDSYYDAPQLRAESYIVADLDTGEVLYEKSADTVRPVASISKLATAVTAVSLFDPNTIVTISGEAQATEGDSGALRVGEEFSVEELLSPLLLSSSNDAGEALALSYGRDEFIVAMNKIVERAGLSATYFSDPSGLSPLNRSTARDLARFASFIHKERPELFTLSMARDKSAGSHTWLNNNQFVAKGEEHYRGGKSGFIGEAGHTLLSTFALPISEVSNTPRNIVVIVLDSDRRYDETRRMISYLLDHVYYGE